MPFKLKIPFYTLNLQLGEGIYLRYPLTDKNAMHIGQNHHNVAKKFSELFQAKMLDEGNFIDVLDEYRDGDFYKAETTVHFPTASDLDLEFLYYFNKNENGYWGIIPALGLEAYGRTHEELEAGLQEIIKLDFLKNNRLHVVQDILETIWFKSVDLTRTEVSFKVPTPREIDQHESEKVEGLLPKAAQLLKIETQQLFGYEKELEQLIREAKNSYSKNILVVGPSGVGKTTLIWELGRVKKRNKIPGRIWESTASLLIKELMFGGGWKPNLVTLAKELSEHNDFLFVRNLMELFEVGRYVGNTVSMAEYMQTFLAKGQINLISECTDDELAKIELEYPGFISLFHLVRLQQPDGLVLESIIKKKVLSIADSKKISISTAAVQEMIRLTKRFTPYEGLPGSPIRFLERLVLRRFNPGKAKKEISAGEVIEYFCSETGLPVFIVDPDIPADLKQVKKYFAQNIFGQNRAIESVVDTLASVKMALTKKDKPIASLLFTGPTGVGKTELAKTLAAFMFGSRDRMVRFDMSEYSDPNAVFRLSGYSGYGGLLSDTIRKEPFCVLLFDEIEKAGQGFFDLLLQILGEGRLTDGNGKHVNFCSTIILMTSNIGVEVLKRPRVEFKNKNQIQKGEILAEQLGAEVQKFFKPELYNRIDQVVIFNALDKKGIRYIVDREIDSFLRREGIKYRKINIEISSEVLDYLGKIGYDEQYGARFLQRTLRDKLIIPIARTINCYAADEQLIVHAKLIKNEIEIEAIEDPLGFDLLLEELEISNFANHASGLRRSIYSLKEGHLFTRLLSEVEMLDMEDEKSLKGTKSVWKDARKAKKYTDYFHCKDLHESLSSEIDVFEEELSLAYLGLKTYDPALNKKIEAWALQFFDYKKQLLGVLLPKLNTCHFSVYGKHPEEIGDLYLRLFKRMGYGVNIYAVWFRESYYNEEILFDIEREDGNKEKIKGPREEYIKTRIPKNFKFDSISPPNKYDVLCGFDFVVSGNCVYLALNNETGIQSWRFSENDERLFLTAANDSVVSTPNLIHRSELFKSNKSSRKIISFKNEAPSIKAKRWSQSVDLMNWLEEHLLEHLIVEVEKAAE
jgi:ATP-dependent Clp protease ATP-binding subunit ClpA